MKDVSARMDAIVDRQRDFNARARKEAETLGILEGFIAEHEIACRESVFQRDLPLHELVAALCESIGWHEEEGDT